MCIGRAHLFPGVRESSEPLVAPRFGGRESLKYSTDYHDYPRYYAQLTHLPPHAYDFCLAQRQERVLGRGHRDRRLFVHG